MQGCLNFISADKAKYYTLMMALSSAFHPAYATDTTKYHSVSDNVIASSSFHFNADLESVNSKEWLLNQIAYAQLLHRPDITKASLERLFAISPNNIKGLFYQAQLDVESDQLDKAQSILTQLQKNAPNADETRNLASYLSIYGDKRSLYQQAMLLTHAGRVDAALNIYKQLFPGGMPTPQLQLEYLQLLDRNSDNWQQVQDGLIRLNQEYKGVPDFQLALATHTLNDNPEDKVALSVVQKLALNPNTADLANAIWIKSLDQTYINQAVLKQYQMLAVYNPNNQEYQKAYIEAQKRLVSETELQQDSTYMAKLDGLKLIKNERYYEAESKLKIAESTRPHDPEILGGLGFVYMRTGRQTQAVGYFEGAKKYETDLNKTSKWNSLISASAYWANLDEGDMFLQKSQYSQAKQKYLASMKLAPEDPYAYNALGNWARVQKQYTQADKYYLQSLQKDTLNETALRGRINTREDQAGQQAAYNLAKTFSSPQKAIVQDRIGELRTNILLVQVNQAIASGDMSLANQTIDQLVVAPPMSPWDKAHIADAIRVTGDAQRADALMAKWSVNSDPETQFAYSLYLSRYGKSQQAIDVLERIPPAKRSVAMQNNLTRLQMGQEFATVTELAKTDKPAAKVKIDQMLASYKTNPSAQVRLISMEYQLGFQKDAQIDANTLKPTSAWDYQTQLDYGHLLFDLQSYDRFEQWQANLPQPTGSEQSVSDYELQRDMLFAQYALYNKDYLTAEQRYKPIAQGSSKYRVDAQFGLVAVYQAQENNEQLQVLSQQMYQSRKQFSTSQISQLATVLDQQGESKQALELTAQTLQQPDAGAIDYRDGMNVEMSHHEYDLSEKMAYKALLIDRLDHEQLSSSETSLVSKKQSATSSASLAHTVPTLHDLYDNADDNWLTRGVKSDIDTMRKRNDGYIEFGFDFSGRDSENKASQIPIEINIPMPKYDGHLLFRTDVVMLDSGDLDYYDKSEAKSSNTSFSSKDQGVALGVGWQANTWSADIGTTPLGFGKQTWVGGVNLSGDLGDVGWKATFSRRPETSSTLSYAGMKVPTNPPVDKSKKGEEWGNVVSTGLKLGGSYDTGGPVGYWWSGQYHWMTGENVEDNTRLGILGGSYWKLLSEVDYRLSLGLNAMYLHYDKNLSDYAYGYGGYYSPQKYFSMSVPVNWYQRVNNSLSYLVSGSISNSWTTEDPLYLDTADSKSEDGGGFGYSLQVAVEQRVSARWYLGLSMDIQRSDFYEPNHMLMYARYTFGDRWQPIEMPVNPLKLYSNFD